MKFNLMHGLGLVAFGAAAVALVIARKPAPAEADLTSHEGRVANVKLVEESPTDKSQSAVLFSVAGLEKPFKHESGQPAYDTLRTELAPGARITVSYDAAGGRRWAQAWSITKTGRALLGYADMKEWYDDSKEAGVVVTVVAGVVGLVLMVLGSRRKLSAGTSGRT